MVNVVIDKDTCIGCGMCVKDCSRKTIELVNKKAVVDLSLCNECSHCVAVCPTSSVSTPQYDINEIIQYDEEQFIIDSKKLLNFIKFRRSIRQFKQKEIEKDKLNSIIEAGRYSPTGGNRQSNRYIIIQNKINEFREIAIKTLYDLSVDLNFDLGNGLGYRKMWISMYNDYTENKLDRMFFNAPSVIVVVSDDPSGNAEVNGGIAVANMELVANSSGLGICCIGFFKRAVEYNPILKEMLGIKENEKFVVAFVIGYPNVKYKRTVNRQNADVTYF